MGSILALIVRYPLLVAWTFSASGCAVLMWLAPGRETFPYHLAWIGLALVYCFEPSPRWVAVGALVTYTALSGAILVHRASEGVIAWEETGEIPLMAVLVGLMLWHAQRRLAALRELGTVADREVRQARQRERLGRMATHEMRTSLTVASGYVELLLTRERPRTERAEVETIRDELVRLRRTSERALRLFSLPGKVSPEVIDLQAFLRTTADRWGAVTERHFVVEASGGALCGSSERLQACLDTLVENALRHTAPGDQVRLVGFRDRGAVYLGVADSGPGLPRDLSGAINRGAAFTDGYARLVSEEPEDADRTGLGLVLVHTVVSARGGRVLAGTSAEGGALLLMRLPAEQPVRGPMPALTDVRRAVPVSVTL